MGNKGKTFTKTCSNKALLLFVGLLQLFLLGDSPSASAGGWEKLPGVKALDVGAGPGGTAWVVGENTRAYSWDPQSRRWEIKPENHVARVDLGPDGAPWFICQDGAIWHRGRGNGPKAIDIGVGMDGSVFIVGQDNQVYRLNQPKGDWEPYPGIKALCVDVDAGGKPVAVTDSHEPDFWNPQEKKWTGFGGFAWDIGIGSSSRFILDNAGQVFRSLFGWKPIPQEPGCSFLALSVGADGAAWAVSSDKSVWRFREDLSPFAGGKAIHLKNSSTGKYFSVNNPGWE